MTRVLFYFLMIFSMLLLAHSHENADRCEAAIDPRVSTDQRTLPYFGEVSLND